MGTETRLYGYIEGISDGTRRWDLERRNFKILKGLPINDSYPFMTRSMFSWPDADPFMGTYRAHLMHFAGTQKGLDIEAIPEWLEKFEKLLAKLYWGSAVAHFETEMTGDWEYRWEGDPFFLGKECDVSPRPTTTWRRLELSKTVNYDFRANVSDIPAASLVPQEAIREDGRLMWESPERLFTPPRMSQTSPVRPRVKELAERWAQFGGLCILEPTVYAFLRIITEPDVELTEGSIRLLEDDIEFYRTDHFRMLFSRYETQELATSDSDQIPSGVACLLFATWKDITTSDPPLRRSTYSMTIGGFGRRTTDHFSFTFRKKPPIERIAEPILPPEYVHMLKFAWVPEDIRTSVPIE